MSLHCMWKLLIRLISKRIIGMHTMVTRCVEAKDGVSNFKVHREVPAPLNQSRFHQGHQKRTVMSGIVLPLGSHTLRTPGVIIAGVHWCKNV